jgi:dipeptidyl aminopeptidase/acylaminoacyl peptidase
VLIVVRRWFFGAIVLLFLPLAFIPAQAAAAAMERHPLRVDDVLDTVSLDQVALSPDGKWIAAVVQRPARQGEVYGRASYEVDPSRADVWRISRTTGAQINLTNGGPTAAGFWCATWSPGGRHLAMLSTQSEADEPRGGDNVRLYLWDGPRNSVRRLSPRPVLTQTRRGSPMNALALRRAGGGGAGECRRLEENAPFVWLDDRRLLVLFMPADQNSALIDAFARPSVHTAEVQRQLREGTVPTATAAGSGAAASPALPGRYQATLAEIDVQTGELTVLADLPAHPFLGTLSISVSPGLDYAAVLAPTGAIPPQPTGNPPYNIDDWRAQKALGIIDLGRGTVKWAALPDLARYPLDLLEWAPSGRAIAFRGRAAPNEATASLFVAAVDGDVRPASGLAVGSQEAGPFSREPSAFWLDDDRLLVRGRQGPDGEDAWWLARPASKPALVQTESGGSPLVLRRSRAGVLLGITGGRLVTLSPDGRRFTASPARAFREGAEIAWPGAADRADDFLLLASGGPDGTAYEAVSLRRPMEQRRQTVLPHDAELLAADENGLVWRDPRREGLFLRETAWRTGTTRDLMALNTHLAAVAWGRTTIIDYVNGSGKPAKAAVILPPDYRETNRYPVIAWVYGGYTVRGPNDYWLDPYLPGIYNLQLYAARGYVVVIPSLSRWSGRATQDIYGAAEEGLMPALDKLIELGIADPRRIGIMGQSLGGYNVYSLVTRTARFRAAVALAGFSDVTLLYSQFPAAARGYPGIEHERSTNWSIVEYGLALKPSPDEDLRLFQRNSPINHVGKVQTPLLLIHGELDERSGLSQAEAFFYLLYRRNKTARLLRYWGENHALGLSPANVRNIVDETLGWFDQYMRPDDASQTHSATKAGGPAREGTGAARVKPESGP